MKVCKRCNVEREDPSFIQIIKRQTHEPGSDDDGYMYYAKATKLCCVCREYLREQQARFQKSKEDKTT